MDNRPKYGERLRNGAICKGVKPYSEYSKDAHLCVVLAYWTEGAGGNNEWVTWVLNIENGGCGHGEYYDCLSDALDSFYKRGVT